jgi:hypothetical protein
MTRRLLSTAGKPFQGIPPSGLRRCLGLPKIHKPTAGRNQELGRGEENKRFKDANHPAIAWFRQGSSQPRTPPGGGPCFQPAPEHHPIFTNTSRKKPHRDEVIG